MHSRPRSYLTFANVASALALFIALAGGTAWAVNEWTGANIVDGSLTSADYKNNDIRSIDVRDDSSAGGGLTAADLGPGSVAGSEVLDGSLGTADTDPLVGGDNNFSVVPLDLSASAGGASTDAEPWGNGSLTLTANCHVGGNTEVNFVNESASTATLNWFYGDGSNVFADGVALGPTGSLSSLKDFGYGGKRIEGQFIYSGAASKITVNLNAVDLTSSCELHGNAIRAAD